MTTLRIMRYALLSGAYDYGSIYTWRSWLGGWFLRVLAQVSFFALIGRLLGAEQQTWFLLVGNAVMLAAMEGVWALNMVGWERSAGTLPLLAASPTSPVLVLASRGVYLIADGSISALGALFVLGPLFGLPLPWPRVLLVIPLTILVGASAYCLGTFLGGIVLGFRGVNSLVANVGLVAVMTLVRDQRAPGRIPRSDRVDLSMPAGDPRADRRARRLGRRLGRRRRASPPRGRRGRMLAGHLSSHVPVVRLSRPTKRIARVRHLTSRPVARIRAIQVVAPRPPSAHRPPGKSPRPR